MTGRQRIAVEATGSGPPLVVLHGWGCGRRAFDPAIPGLAERYRVIRVDLPGYGGSRPDRCGGALEATAEAILDAAPRPAAWLGWSLGGLVALAAARRAPEALSGLTLVCTSPCFVAAPGWPGIEAALLDDFAASVAADAASARARFLGFQLAGSTGARRAWRVLRGAAEADGAPDAASLGAGLGILRETDLRGVAGALSCPVAAILGGADPLVPAALEPALRREAMAVRVVPGGGHAPFASHPEAFVETVMELNH